MDEEKKVIDLKSIITDKYGYKTCDQRLSCKTKSLMNNDKLNIYNTENENFIYLSLYLIGGNKNQDSNSN
jgi:hypothetical protein